MENKHTSGPWWPVQDSCGRWYITTYRDYQTADEKPTRFGASIVHGVGDHTEKRTSGNEEANARLIAAAPELFEALEIALNALKTASRQLTQDHKIVLSGKVWGEGDIKRIESALAKAKGE